MIALAVIVCGGIACGYAYWLGKTKAGTHVCNLAPQVSVPWAPNDGSADRPPIPYVTVKCPDTGCDQTIDLPVSTRIKHTDGLVNVTITADTTDIAAHELGHAWNT